jgi:4-hydroxybenzoate polyprenyltransferase
MATDEDMPPRQAADTATSSSTVCQAPSVAKRPKGAWGLLVRFGELIRFSHTLFALPFSVWAMVMSLAVSTEIDIESGYWAWKRWLGILLCMVFARSAAMAFNRWVDADVDASNPRTATRHIPAGLLSKQQVIVFWIAMSLLFVASCVLFLPNRLPLLLSVPVLVFICGYSLAKRFTSLCHLWLGAALSLAPICTWIAMRGEVVQENPRDLLPAIVLGVAVFLWVSGFDVIYALQDEAFDRRAGLFSIPAFLGKKYALWLSRGLHGMMIGFLLLLGVAFPQLSLGMIYFLCVAVVAVMLLWEHLWADPNDLLKLNVAFFQVNVLISLLLMIGGSIDTLLR